MTVDEYLKNKNIRPEQRARIILYAAKESRSNGGEWSQSGYVGRLDALISNLDETLLRADLREFRDAIAKPSFDQINYVAFEFLYKKLPAVWK